jgi:hypothetical protein
MEPRVAGPLASASADWRAGAPDLADLADAGSARAARPFVLPSLLDRDGTAVLG